MLSFLKNHPFAVETHFERSTVLTYAVKKEELELLIPECLTLDTFNDEWAFIAVALVKTKGLRPKGFPKFIGNDFYLAGYRIFVRYTDKRGKNLRGLYIIKSETNKKKMEFFGNLFTHYNYTTTDISDETNNDIRTVSSKKSDFSFSMDVKEGEKVLPKDSPFSDWKTARRFAGPLPFTFTYNKEKKEVLIIEGVRQNWKPKAIEVTACHFAFINNFNFKSCHLANAFVIEDVPYFWRKGKKEIWQP
jgi:hypothetical protein